MTPDKQVEEIIRILAPGEPSQTDAVFLVQRYIKQTEKSLAAQSKEIALLEAKLEHRSHQLQDVINDKLMSEQNLRKELAAFAKEEHSPQKPVGKP